jgi:hypothetical protein
MTVNGKNEVQQISEHPASKYFEVGVGVGAVVVGNAWAVHLGRNSKSTAMDTSTNHTLYQKPQPQLSETRRVGDAMDMIMPAPEIPSNNKKNQHEVRLRGRSKSKSERKYWKGIPPPFFYSRHGVTATATSMLLLLGVLTCLVTQTMSFPQCHNFLKRDHRTLCSGVAFTLQSSNSCGNSALKSNRHKERSDQSTFHVKSMAVRQHVRDRSLRLSASRSDGTVGDGDENDDSNTNYNDNRNSEGVQDMSFWNPGDESTFTGVADAASMTAKDVANLYGYTENVEQQKENFVVQVQYTNLMNSEISPDLWDASNVRRAILADLFSEEQSSSSKTGNLPKTRTLSLDSQGSRQLMELDFLGVGTMSVPVLVENPNSKGTTDTNSTAEIKMESRPCLFLAKASTGTTKKGTRSTIKEALPIPMSQERYRQFLPLLVATRHNVPMSKTKCLQLNSILINRDNGLFDGLPWAEWTILSSSNRDFDATGKNRAAKKFRTGKKDAFDRFMGKDWPGRSWSLGNLAQKALNEMKGGAPTARKGDETASKNAEGCSEEDDVLDTPPSTFNKESLLRRVLEMDLKEAKSELAEAEQIFAVHVREHGDEVEASELVPLSIDFVFQERLQYQQSLVNAQQRVKETTQALLGLSNNTTDGSTGDKKGRNEGGTRNTKLDMEAQPSSEGITGLLESIVERSLRAIDGKNNTAPYRGAYGYAPTIDTWDEMSGKSVDQIYPYKGPMNLLMEILGTQLRSTVVGTVLENASLEQGAVQLGGAGVLQRRPPPKGSRGTTVLGGEMVDVPVENSKTERYNDEVQTGDVRIVECDTEEAVVWAMATDRSVSIDPSLYEALSVPLDRVMLNRKDDDTSAVKEGTAEALPWVVVNERALEERYQNSETSSSSSTKKTSTSSESNSDRRPQTTSALFGGGNNGSSDSMFASSAIVDKIQSAEELDAMSISNKARILQETDSFKGTLPRPRVLRLSGGSSAPIDRLMLPLMDEAVRNQVLIRDAEARGDMAIANQLRRQRSRRHVAKDLAQSSTADDNSALANVWQEEADLAKSLRADVTQDEGSYSRFLDKDEWYERDRLARIAAMKKNTKSRFFNLD